MEGVRIVFWHWWVAAVLLGLLEMFVPGAALIWLGLAAGVVGLALLALPDLSWQVQFGGFAVIAIAAVAASRFVPTRRLEETDQPTLNRRAEQYLGRTLRLETAIVNGRGRAYVGDSLWTVAGEEDLPQDTAVRVIGVDGALLRVERAPG
ncbi:NfeD family protein [Rhodocista pekingensis]|uniref:NfeD family protein n=1 Tax=Rhodocista pekingensis TaxID=201185 RepID=A0ABW2KV56_9PROT